MLVGIKSSSCSAIIDVRIDIFYWSTKIYQCTLDDPLLSPWLPSPRKIDAELKTVITHCLSSLDSTFLISIYSEYNNGVYLDISARGQKQVSQGIEVGQPGDRSVSARGYKWVSQGLQVGKPEDRNVSDRGYNVNYVMIQRKFKKSIVS